MFEYDDWAVRKQSNAHILITEKSNSENLKPDTSDNFKTHLTDNAGMLFHWGFLTALKSCPHRAQPPLPECTPAQFQTWRIFPVLSQLPQQPDPCPGWNSFCPAPVPQQSGQRCHPELQPGMCPKQLWSLTPEIVWSSSQERAVCCFPHLNFCLYFLSCSTHLQQGGVTILIFVNLQWVDLHSDKVILINKEICIPD